VEDVAIGFAAIESGPTSGRLIEAIEANSRSQAVRLGVPSNFFREACSPGINEAFDRAVEQFEQAGVTAVSRELPGTEEGWELFTKGGLASPELSAFLSAELPEWLDTLDERVEMRIRGAEKMRAAEYIYRQQTVERLSARAEKLFAEVDVLITPTVATTPPRLVDVANQRGYAERNYLALRNTVMVNLMGLCALTIPIGTDQVGMPVGLQVIGGPGGDAHVLSIGLQLERALAT
jgi:aspartyl-tRNA(Asn)/glutamyl-tRNA(Gln) amidotransferase subunit A